MNGDKRRTSRSPTKYQPESEVKAAAKYTLRWLSAVLLLGVVCSMIGGTYWFKNLSRLATLRREVAGTYRYPSLFLKRYVADTVESNKTLTDPADLKINEANRKLMESMIPRFSLTLEPDGTWTGTIGPGLSFGGPYTVDESKVQLEVDTSHLDTDKFKQSMLSSFPSAKDLEGPREPGPDKASEYPFSVMKRGVNKLYCGEATRTTDLITGKMTSEVTYPIWNYIERTEDK